MIASWDTTEYLSHSQINHSIRQFRIGGVANSGNLIFLSEEDKSTEVTIISSMEYLHSSDLLISQVNLFLQRLVILKQCLTFSSKELPPFSTQSSHDGGDRTYLVKW